MMDALTAMRLRRTVREFEPGKSISKETLETIADAGRVAATAINIQPWEFVIITNRDMLKKMADLAEYGKHLASASAAIAVLCKDSPFYLEDGCAATQNMLVAATALGIASAWIDGEKKEYGAAMKQLLGAPAEIKLVSIIALGYSNDETTPEKRPLEEVIHWEKF
ncbi:MAG TPA: nitroreductase family protein [Candidatus Hydrogenedentes bacterium]|jgi:nitroreductase|nr:nitroreductase family protein [Candidatus Hydrogenedentota bacterium]HPX85747.1 nitroreductase family protein [Candidatus Hydrogenedentota bacterium]